MKKRVRNLLTVDHVRTFSKNILIDVIGSIFFAFGIYNFVAPAGFAPGGVSGIAIIVNHFTHLPIGASSLIINIPIILISLRILGPKYLLRTFQTVVINTIFLDLVCPLFPVYTGAPLMAALFSGALVGIGLAVIYQNKSCSGGSDLIIFSLKALRPHMSVGQITLFIDGLIILAGGLVYRDIDAILYGFIYSATMTVVLDKIMYGFVSGKMAMIITDPKHEPGITKAIAETVVRGSTVVKGMGSYSRKDKTIMFCACSRHQVPILRRVVRDNDPKALVIVSSFDEVYGEGFMPIDD